MIMHVPYQKKFIWGKFSALCSLISEISYSRMTENLSVAEINSTESYN